MGYLPFGMGKNPIKTSASLWARRRWLWTFPTERYTGWYSCCPVATETVVLSLPSITGMKIAPWVSRSTEIRSFQDRVSDHRHFWKKGTYTLLPCPICGHEITVAPLAVRVKLTVRHIVYAINQVGVGKDSVDNLPRVSVPDLVISGHPLGRGPIFWTEAVIPGSVRLPRYVAEFDGVDRGVKVVVVGYWCRVVVRN